MMKSATEWRRIRAVVQRGVAQGLTDTEIGEQIGKSPSRVHDYRRRLGLPKSDKFCKNFARLYGAQALHMFCRLYQRGWTLQDLGDRYGFSREYARQVVGHLKARRVL